MILSGNTINSDFWKLRMKLEMEVLLDFVNPVKASTLIQWSGPGERPEALYTSLVTVRITL